MFFFFTPFPTNTATLCSLANGNVGPAVCAGQRNSHKSSLRSRKKWWMVITERLMQACHQSPGTCGHCRTAGKAQESQRMGLALLPSFFPADIRFLSNVGKPRPPCFKALSAVCMRGCVPALPTQDTWGLALTLHHRLGRAGMVLWSSQNPNLCPSRSGMG